MTAHQEISQGQFQRKVVWDSLESNFILSVLLREELLRLLFHRTYLILLNELMLGFPKGFKIDEGPSTTVL